jgi:3-hydroxymyristoyl/3-hydroxydecanoyl-(acyl carrier protein) dehydratase
LRHISEYADIFLPVGQMLQIDRVREVTGDRVVCETDLERNWVFPLHFPGDPIFPGSLIIEGAGQAIAIWAWENELRGDPRLVRVEAEFRFPVVPADGILTYVGTIKRRRNLCVGTVSVLCGDRQVAQVKGSLVVTSPIATPAQAPSGA